MKRIQLLPTVIVLFYSVQLWAVDIEIQDNGIGLIPAFMVDTTGFSEVGVDASFSPDELINPNRPIFPMYPIFKSGKVTQKQFIGVVIPKKYLENSPVSESKRVSFEEFHSLEIQKGGLDLLQRLNEGKRRMDSDGLISIDSLTQNYLAIKAQMSSVRFDDGNTLIPYIYEGSVYGISSKYNVIRENGYSVGIGISFGRRNQINLGNYRQFGGFLNLMPTTELVGKKGFNIFSNINDLFEDFNLMISGESMDSLIDKTIQLSPFLIDSIQTDYRNQLAGLPDLSFKNRAQFEIQDPPAVEINSVPDPTQFSSELQSALEKINQEKHLKKEIKWKEKVTNYANSEGVYLDESANQLIQLICNRISQSYQVPKEIWPKCRIKASFVPNAWAYPGGDIFITAGLLGILSDLDSVMLVLGHEIGHGVGRHVTRRMPAIKAINFVANSIAIAVNYGLTAYGVGAGWGTLGSVSFLNWFPKSQAIAFGGSFLYGRAMRIAFFAPIVGVMAHSRELEWEADRFGQQTAYSVGADQDGMYRGWGEFIDYLDKYFELPHGLMKKLKADHPDGENRYKKIEKRFADIQKNLSHTHELNPIDDSLRDQYAEIHARLKPYSIAYGGRMVKLRESGKNVQSNSEPGFRRKQDLHFLDTLASSHGDCIMHALGAGE